MDDERFFNRLCARDPQAQKELIQAYNPRIFFYFRNRIKGASNYEDMVQEVFSAFFSGLDQGKLAGSSWIAPFIFGIAKRVVYNYFYRQKKNNDIQKNICIMGELSSSFSEAERMDNQKRVEVLGGLIKELPRIDRLILNAFYMQERKIGEIADMTGRSRHYISVRKERAIKRIRSEILKKNLY